MQYVCESIATHDVPAQKMQAPRLNPLPRIRMPGRIRTPDLLIRSQTLYPAELRAQLQYPLLTQVQGTCSRTMNISILTLKKNPFIIFWHSI